MIKEALEFLKEEFNTIRTLEFNGEDYSSRKLYKVPESLRSETTVYSLTGLVDFIKDNFDKDERLLISILDEKKIVVQTQLNSNKGRETVIVTLADTPNIKLNSFMDLETFNIQLQSVFVSNDDSKTLLRILGNLKSSNVKNTGDNGISQTVETKRGITMAQEEIVPNPVNLKPFRTFTEISQPESLFVFRLKEYGDSIHAGLFEADGGAWKNVARLSIKAFLEEHLNEQVENKQVLIIG